MSTFDSTYHRRERRHGPVSLRTRIYQGLGAIPGVYKDFAFNTFLLFFYNQILGLSAAAASIAITIALVADALSDPLVGSYSDRLVTRWGRRHPLMYVAAIPLGLCLAMLFAPPELSANGLFVWLLIFALLTRTAMTFFGVPWAALFAELSEDYYERTTLLSYRFLIGFAGGVTFTWCTWTFIFPSTAEFTPGHLNPEPYWLFGAIAGGLAALFALLSTLLTQRETRYLLQPQQRSAYRLRFAFTDLFSALRNRDYRVLFFGLLVSSAITGTLAALEIYLNTYFWGLTPEDLRWFAVAGAGGILAFLTIPILQHHIDKKYLLVGSMLISLGKGLTLINLRLLDWLPSNGSDTLLIILIANEFVGAYILTITVMMFVSMVADTLDAQELSTGFRQEGTFSAAISFSAKATTGVGIVLSGLILEFAVGLPVGAKPEQVSSELVTRMGLVIGIAIPLFYLVPFYMATKYNISRVKHAEIRSALERQRERGIPEPERGN